MNLKHYHLVSCKLNKSNHLDIFDLRKDNKSNVRKKNKLKGQILEEAKESCPSDDTNVTGENLQRYLVDLNRFVRNEGSNLLSDIANQQIPDNGTLTNTVNRPLNEFKENQYRYDQLENNE